MAVMMIMDSPESTTAQYDRTNELLGIGGDSEAPEGLIQHVAASDGNGLVIVDVWESADAFGRFIRAEAVKWSNVIARAGATDH